MSEIKPKFWIAKSDFVSLTDADEGCDALHQCATVSRDGCKILPDDEPLYTADQLAEAVAAERERCIQLIRNEGITPATPDDPSEEGEAINDALHHVIEAIRSSAK